MGTRVTPYSDSSTESKRLQVGRMFDRIAPTYDLLNHMLSLGIDIYWRKQSIRILLKHLEGKESAHVMDMATGTGDFALEAVSMGVAGKITGVDISPGMLEVGRKKVARRGLGDRIELLEADSVALPFLDGTFDAYTVGFGVRNFEDLNGGLTDMLRVLKPGGLAVILEFSKPRVFPLKQVFGFYFRFMLPFFGRLVSKDRRAYTYLQESVHAFPVGDAFLSFMSQAGYEHCAERPLTGGIVTVYTGYKPEGA